MLYQSLAGRAIASHNVDDSGRQSGLLAKFREHKCGEGSKFGGFQDYGVSRRQCRRDLPRQHEKREIPRNNLTHDTTRLVAGELLLEQLGPTGVVVEVPRHERDVDVAALANRLAIVHGFKDREEPGVLLHQSRQSVEIASPSMRSEGSPLWRCSARRANGSIDVSGPALGDRGQFLAIRGVDRVEIFSRGRRLPRSSDEESKVPSMTLQPSFRFFGILGSGPILHADKFFGNAHWVRLVCSGLITTLSPALFVYAIG